MQNKTPAMFTHMLAASALTCGAARKRGVSVAPRLGRGLGQEGGISGLTRYYSQIKHSLRSAGNANADVTQLVCRPSLRAGAAPAAKDKALLPMLPTIPLSQDCQGWRQRADVW